MHHEVEETSPRNLVSNIGIKQTKNNKFFTSHNKSKLEVATGTMVETKAIFIKSGQYSHKTCFTSDNMEIQHVLMFHMILIPFVCIF